VHIAFYEFPSLEAANMVMGSDKIAALIKEFDHHWQGKVTRTREVVECIQEI
jgi:hypothetical protein